MADAPTPVTPLEGKTAIDEKMFFEPERLSYQSGEAIAAAIAQAVKDDILQKTVVIVGTQLLADFANLQAIYATMESMTRDYESVASLGRDLSVRRSGPGRESTSKETSAAEFAVALTGAIAPATALVNAAVGLVSFFREDVEYYGAKTVVDTLAFEISLAAHLLQGGAKEVIIPDLRVDPTIRTDPGSLSFGLAKVQKAKSNAWALIGPMISKLVQLEAELERAARNADQSELDRIAGLVSDLRRDMEPVTEPLARNDQRLAALQDQWSRREESSGLAELARFLRAERILDLKPMYLHAKVVSSGGHHRVSRSWLRTLFVGDGLSFAGGATARWALLGTNGRVEKGGILVRRATGSFRELAY